MPGIDSRAPERTETSSGSLGVAELLAGALLERRQRLVDLLVEALGEAVLAHVGDARLGRDREPARHPIGAQDARHLRDVGALAAEQLAHVPRALGELVDPFRRHPARRSYRATAWRQRMPAWCSSVSSIARSAWRSARASARRRVGQRPADGVDQEGVRLLVQRERARLAGAAHHAAGGAREAAEVLALAARRARGQLRRQAGGEQELEAEGELVGVPGARRLGVEQRELVAEQVVDAGMRLGGVEQARRPRRTRARRRRARRRRSRRRG